MNNKFYDTNKEGRCNFAIEWASNLRDEFFLQYSEYDNKEQHNYIQRVRYLAKQIVKHGNEDLSLSVAIDRLYDIQNWIEAEINLFPKEFTN